MAASAAKANKRVEGDGEKYRKHGEIIINGENNRSVNGGMALGEENQHMAYGISGVASAAAQKRAGKASAAAAKINNGNDARKK